MAIINGKDLLLILGKRPKKKVTYRILNFGLYINSKNHVRGGEKRPSTLYSLKKKLISF